MNDIEHSVKKIISEQIGKEVDTITNDMLLKKNLGLDSLDIIELVMSLEDFFNIKIQDEDIGNLRTVMDIIKYVKKIPKKC